MAIEKFDKAVMIQKLKELLGEESGKMILELEDEEAIGVVKKLIESWMEKKEKTGVENIFEDIRIAIKEGDDEYKVGGWWDDKKILTEKIESAMVPIQEKKNLVEWLMVVRATELIESRYVKTEEVLAALWLVGQISDVETTNEELKKCENNKEGKWKTVEDEMKFVEEIGADTKILKNFQYEKVSNVKCFYFNGDDHKFVPALAVFPGMSDEEIEKLKNSLPIGLPKEYEKFLRQANGIRLGWDFYWWGARRIYDEAKHLEQNYSLVNSRYDEQLKSILSPTEIVFGSDKHGNVFVMDIVNNSVAGIFREGGNELATPERRNFNGLGELLNWLLEMEEKISAKMRI